MYYWLRFEKRDKTTLSNPANYTLWVITRNYRWNSVARICSITKPDSWLQETFQAHFSFFQQLRWPLALQLHWPRIRLSGSKYFWYRAITRTVKVGISSFRNHLARLVGFSIHKSRIPTEQHSKTCLYITKILEDRR